MITLLKNLAPTIFYIIALFCAVFAIFGQPRWALLMVIFLSPLRNVVERLAVFPLGDQLLDILFMSLLAGWLASSLFLRAKFIERSSLNIILII